MTRLGPSMDPAMALQYTKHGPLYIGYILHSMQQKWDQGTLGRQRLTLVRSRTRLGPSMDPAMDLNTPNIALLYWLYICIPCNKNGIMGLWGHKGPTSLGLGPALAMLDVFRAMAGSIEGPRRTKDKGELWTNSNLQPGLSTMKT